MGVVILTSGDNQPLEGQRIGIDLGVSSLGGAAFVAEDASGPRVLTRGDAVVQVRLDGQRVLSEFTLPALPPSIGRLRLLVWSESPTRILSPAEAHVRVDGTHRFTVAIGGRLRAAEVLEIYSRLGLWKLRAIASGWDGHLPAMAKALRLPEAAFGPPPPSRPAPSTRRRRPSPVGPSPAVGPGPLRGLVDSVIGPGPRTGSNAYLGFELEGAEFRLGLQQHGDQAQIVATADLGRGEPSEAIAETALLVTGQAPLARVTLDDDGRAFATAAVSANMRNLDTALIKAMLSEVWGTAHRFLAQGRSLGWRGAPIAAEPPRELRLGVVEELQSVEVWGQVRERLTMNSCIPLADAPEAVLASTDDGQLCIGPSLLTGTARAWTIIVERVLRSDVVPRPGLWRWLAGLNTASDLTRFGIAKESGVGRPTFVVVNFSALQLPRTQVLDDLQAGLEAVETVSTKIDPMLRTQMPQARVGRRDLPWMPARQWSGPGTEVRDNVLVRELLGLPKGAPAPSGFIDRVQTQRASLGLVGLGYLAHLALLRAESSGKEAATWLRLARGIVPLVPTNSPDQSSAPASLHARLAGLSRPKAPAKPPPKASPPPRQPTQPKSTQTSSPPPRPTPGPEPAPRDQPRRRRWRLFGNS